MELLSPRWSYECVPTTAANVLVGMHASSSSNVSAAFGNFTTLGNANCTNKTSECPDYIKMEHLEGKLCLVGIVGTLVALSGIVSNSLLVYVFFRPSVRLSTVLYLAVLAMLDIWMLVTYILIFPFNIWYDYLESLPLFRFWMFYVRPMLTISKMIQLASTYLIVAATLERYLSQVGVSCTRNKRSFVIFAVIFSSILLKWTTYLEVNIVYRAGCEGFAEKDIVASELARDPLYSKVVSFYMSHIIQVFLPFAILLTLNVLIISRMKRTTSSMGQNETVRSVATYPAASIMFFKSQKKDEYTNMAVVNNNKAHSAISQRIESKKQLKEATHMLIMIVFLYLIVNSVSLVVTTMEHTSDDWLGSHQTFYTFAVDTISFLSVINSSIRVLVYYFFNGTIRSEFAKLFLKCTGRGGAGPEYATVNDRPNKLVRASSTHQAGPRGQHEPHCTDTGSSTPVTPAMNASKKAPLISSANGYGGCKDPLAHAHDIACDECGDDSVPPTYHSYRTRGRLLHDYGSVTPFGSGSVSYPPHYETCV